MNSWRRDAEVGLNLGLSRRSTMEESVERNDGQILPLLWCEARGLAGGGADRAVVPSDGRAA